MIFGVGCDTVAIDRFAAKLASSAKLRDRLFTPGERELKVQSLAARFAAKEAAIKALGGSAIKNAAGEVAYDLQWHDLEVLPTAGARPEFSETAGLKLALAIAGVQKLHLSLSHDGDTAQAFVVAELRESA